MTAWRKSGAMRVVIISVVAALVGGVVLVWCTGSRDSATTTASPKAAGSLTPVPPVSLREVDFSGRPFDRDLVDRAGGGQVASDRVRYIDLTGDGREEAVVIVESGGTLGDIGVGVFSAQGPGIVMAYFRKFSGRVEIRGTTIVVIEGTPAAGDAACCPAQLKETTIEWRGTAFEVTSEKLVKNPVSSGGAP